MELGPAQTDLMRMPPSLRLSALAMALCAFGLVTLGRAQATSSSATNAAAPDNAATPVLKPAAAPTDTAPTPGPAPAPQKHERVMSNAVASFLADGAPKYHPPPKEPDPKSEEEQPDLRETDKPRNRIIRLPKYVVKEPPPPVFSEHQLHSKEEMTKLAMSRYYGMHIGNIGGLNESTALFMYQEQERLDNMTELKDEANNAKRAGDPTAADYISKQTNRTYYRPSDFGWNSDGGGK